MKRLCILLLAVSLLQVVFAETAIMKFGGYPAKDKSCVLERSASGFDIRITVKNAGERSQCVVFLGREEFESYMHLLTMLDLLYYERNEQYVRIDAYTTYWYMYNRGRKYLVFTQTGNPELAWLASDYVNEITAWFVRELKAKEEKRERLKEQQRQQEESETTDEERSDRQRGKRPAPVPTVDQPTELQPLPEELTPLPDDLHPAPDALPDYEELVPAS